MPSTAWKFAAVIAAAMVASCGGSDGGGEAPTQQTATTYLQNLPTWEQYSPLKDPAAAHRTGDPVTSPETIENVPVLDPVTKAVVGYRTEDYECKSTQFSMTDTPEKIVMFSPDREVLWPGGMVQGKSHRDGVGSLLPLTIRERAPIKVSIPSLAATDNFRVVESPDQAEVNQAIGSMVQNADTSKLVTPSTIQFVMEDYNSEQSFALQAQMSGRYMGFKASASASVNRTANERTVMVYFFEKMFEVVVEPPSTPGQFFSDEFTQAKLDEQIALGKIGPDNPPVYVSNVVYGRMMAFTFTSTASSSEIKAALSAAYNGIFSASGSISEQHKTVLEQGRISVTSLGGESGATVAVIASGNWRQYFTQSARLTSAYPISYTFRNLRDGSIAKVSEATQYDIKECNLKDTAFSGFVLDSFETAASVATWASSGTDLVVEQGLPSTPQSIFYGYAHALHKNTLDQASFLYDVHYLVGPSHFTGDKSDFYRGELSFWYKPDENVTSQNTGQYCYWILGIFRICSSTLVQASEPVVAGKFKVLAYDNVTTFDQVVLRGGDEPFAVLTLTYNPKASDLDLAWKRHAIPLTNDATLNSQCDRSDPALRGCWLVEDQVASEEQMKYVLARVTDFRIRASYPLHRLLCADDPVPLDVTQCVSKDFVPYGYVGGYFDEVKLNKTSL